MAVKVINHYGDEMHIVFRVKFIGPTPKQDCSRMIG